MKDYLLSFSILGLVLGFYSALVLIQSKPTHATVHSSRAVGTMSSELGGTINGSLTENHSAPDAISPSVSSDENLTR